MALFDREKEIVRHFTIKDGLPSDEVYAVIEDHNGNLWVSTNYGIARMSVSNWDRGISQIKVDISIFNTGFGATGNEFNMGAYCQDKEGLIYFGGIAGVFLIDPSEVENTRQDYQSNLVFTDFRIKSTYNEVRDSRDNDIFLGRIINDLKFLQLEHFESSLAVRFSLLSYGDPKEIEYAYMMEGLGNSWVNLGSRNSLDFSLPPGNFTLKIRGRTGSGQWSSNIKQLNIQVNAPFWETAYFRANLVFFMIISIIGLHQMRTKAIRKRNAELSIINEKLNKEISMRKKNRDLIERCSFRYGNTAQRDQ